MRGRKLKKEKEGQPNPAPSWLSASAWSSVLQLEKFEAFNGLSKHVTTNLEQWKGYFETDYPHTAQLPGDWSAKLSPFHRMLLLRYVLMCECHLDDT